MSDAPNASPEERAALIKQFADVPDTTKALIFFAMQGICPYCFANTERELSMLPLLKRGYVGDKLQAKMAQLKAEDAANKIDSDTGHAVDCAAIAQMRAEMARQGIKLDDD